MKDPFGLFKSTISVSYALLLLEITTERGIECTAVLRGSTLTESGLNQPHAQMSPHQWSKIVLNAIRLTKDKGLGREYGLKLRPTAHGALGYALLSCPNVKAALNLLVSFFNITIRDFIPSWDQDETYVYLYMREAHPVFGAPEQAEILRRFLVECMLFSMVRIMSVLTGQAFNDVNIFVDWSQPDHCAEKQASLPPIHFNQPHNYIRFSVDHLSLQNAQADPVAYQQALIYCEYEKARLANYVLKDICLSVKAEFIYSPKKGYPTLAEVAHRLCLSERTLRRHLQSRGTTFSRLLDEVRLKHAEKLLSSDNLGVQEVAGLLGYHESTNFIRAFKKWTGVTPAQFRVMRRQ